MENVCVPFARTKFDAEKFIKAFVDFTNALVKAMQDLFAELRRLYDLGEQSLSPNKSRRPFWCTYSGGRRSRVDVRGCRRGYDVKQRKHKFLKGCTYG